MSDNPSKKVQVLLLGGQDEIGKNMQAVRYGDDILVIDAGMKFPDEELLGIDKVIPNFDYLVQNKHLIRAIILTHGHEDHIGALPYLLEKIDAPVYGTKLTLGLAGEKLKDESGLGKKIRMVEVKAGDVVTIGPFSVEFMRVCHSIADGVALAIKTPAGQIVHSGDFKIDYTPVDGKVMDINRFAELGKEGVLVFLSDSTNADALGVTPSEKTVGENFDRIFRQAKKRIIIASFASNIHRVQQAIDIAQRYGRKVAMSGRSMLIVSRKAKELGYLKYPEETFISLDSVKKYPPEKIVIVTTGSQGEPMSALTRMSMGEHKQIKIVPGDTVIISAIPIPGNEKYVDKTIDRLFKCGADVIYESFHGVHVSGHAAQEELKLLLTLVRPKYFIPIHGEFRHLVFHAKVAESTGVEKKNIFTVENGTLLEFSREKGSVVRQLPSPPLMVDGGSVGEIGTAVLRERKQLSENGMVVVGLVVSLDKKEIVSGPEISSQGFVFIKSSEELMKAAEEKVVETVQSVLRKKEAGIDDLKHAVREKLGKFLHRETRRNPLVVPMIYKV